MVSSACCCHLHGFTFCLRTSFRCIPSTKWRISSSQEDCSPLFSHSIRQPFRLATAFRLCYGRVAGSNGAHCGANPADHSAMTRALVEQSVRVPHCEEHHGESSQSPNQRHRSRPRLRSLTIKYLWRAPLTHWSATHHRYLPQKPCSQLGLGTRPTPLSNVELAQRMDPQRCVRC